MLKRQLINILLLLCSQSLFAQVDVNIRVKQTISRTAKLVLYTQSGTEVVDSTFRLSQGLYRFKLPEGYKQGVYKFVLNKNIGFDFIIAKEPSIDIETVVFAAEDSTKSISSIENELFFQFQKLKKKYNQKCWFLNSLADFYPDSVAFKKQIQVELANAQSGYNESVKILANRNEKLLASSLIRLELRPQTEIGLNGFDRNLKLRKDWWSGTNLSDPRLAYSPLLKSKIRGYIDLFVDESITKEKQDSLFVVAANTIMNLDASVEIKAFFRDILMQSFIDSEYNNITKYLYETTFERLQKLKLSPEDLNSYEIQQKNDVGTKASDFSFKLIDGTNQKLSKVVSNYKLLVFWSMWCPHCIDMMPELFKMYQNSKSKGFEIIAVCIDDELEGWKKNVDEKKYFWLNTLEPDNGKSKIIKDYNVDGTPKMLLIDKNLMIISRPSTVKQVEAKLKEVLKLSH